MSIQYLCIEEECINKKRQLLTYLSAKQTHRNHKIYILDPVNFIELFSHQRFLFSHAQLKQLQRDMVEQYNQMEQKTINRIVEMVTLHYQQAKQTFLTNTLEIAKVFHLDNEIEFVDKLKKVSQTSSAAHLTYLTIANKHLKNGQVNLKPSILQTFRSQMNENITKTQLALKQSMEVFASLMKFNQISTLNQVNQSSFQEVTIQEHKMEEQFNFNDAIVFQKAKEKEIVQKELQDYFLPASVTSTPVIQQISNPIPKIDNIAIIDIESLPHIQQVPRFTKSIKKQQKKGGKPKEPIVKQFPLPKYQNKFKQLDMDSFFPKCPPQEIVKPLSFHAESQQFQKNPFPEEIVIQNTTDAQILEDNAKRITKNTDLVVSPIVSLDPNPIFNIFTLHNHIKTLRLKDFVILANTKESLKTLLLNNSHSLQTIMLQQCWLLPIDITLTISKLVNLKKLKLHASYQRKYKLCFQHLFHLKLEYLSLSSAIFIDRQGEQILYSSKLGDIYHLDRLKYLCLYNCYPVHSELIGYLNPKLYYSLEHFNLGITDITSDVIPELGKFQNIRQFSLDQTQLKGKDIIQIIQKMRNNNIRQLSLWQLNNSSWSQDKRGYLNGFITQNQMLQLARLLPHLQYLNISHCKSLRGFNLLKFLNLKNVCVSNDLYRKKDLIRFRKRFNVYIQNLDQQAIIKATQVQSSQALNYTLQVDKQQEDSQFNPNDY